MKLLIRTDGSPLIGTGHVMRCLSLAHGWQRSGGGAVFASAEITPALEDRLRGANFELARIRATAGSAEDTEQTVKLACEHSATWIVADGYRFDSDYQRRLKAAGFRLLMMDDYGHAKHYFADLVLNQNLHATSDYYQNREVGTRLLLGTRYVLLRHEFLAFKTLARALPAKATKVLVTLGGADPENATRKVIEGIAQLSDVEAVVVVGGSNPYLAELQTVVANSSSAIRLVVDARNMPELMAWADVAIAAGGTTSWELAFMGLPCLMLVLAANQEAVAEGLEKAQVVRKTTSDTIAKDLRDLLSDEPGRKAMSERARRLVDGLGVSRVIAELRASALQLRRVTAEDCRQIWEWANDPDARAVSLSSEPIPWDNHLKWFASRADSPACFFYFATNGSQQPTGQIRYDLKDTEAVVSVSLAKEARGQGYGAALIVRGSQQFFADSPVKLIRAYIKPQNTASVSAFEKAGYVAAEPVQLAGQTVLQFILSRETKS